jgi:hypothetical protein|tara:strand:+ start:113 stop:343 length:231 start_codon:yes stop_codon:yes gene_type:complete
MKNNKREKFVKLANSRVISTLDKIRLIGNLADKRYYEYSDKDVKKMFDALSKELNLVKSKFSNLRTKVDTNFKLEE